jgi:Flp pilus assembly protein TadD
MNANDVENVGQTPDDQYSVYQLLRRGTHALQGGQLKLAVQLLERAHRLDDANGDVVLNLGGAYILTKRFTQAVTILEPLSVQEPHNPMVWTNLGAAYLGNPILARDEDQKRAIAAFERAFELDPATPSVAYNLGLIYRDRQEEDEAQYWFRQALKANPDDEDASRNVARLSRR